MPSRIFHIIGADELAAARVSGHLAPASLASEGFVHASFRDQVVATANTFFAGRGDLRLIELDTLALGGAVRIEPATATGATPNISTQQFPHVYAPIPMTAVLHEHPLAPDAFGVFTLPAPLAHEAALDARQLSALIGSYAWYDHPEGPKFVETHRDDHRTSGHWLFLPGAISAFHRVLNNEELWLAHAGRLVVHVIDLEGRHTQTTLGVDVAAGERPILAVPRGHLQAA